MSTPILIPEMPLPWASRVIGECDSGNVCEIIDPDFRQVADSLYERDAALIVRAVNSHADLKAATECTLALDMDADEGRAILERHGFVWDDRFHKPATEFVAKLCRAALAKAEAA